MHRRSILGLAALGIGLLGYAAGTAVPYPGRAFSLSVGMLGLALVVTGRVEA
jgi:hypothetical protein